MNRPRSGWHLRALVLALLIPMLPGCDGLLSTSRRQPNEARVVVTGSSTTALRLVTSTNFSAELDPETGIYNVHFVTSNEVEQALPIERTVRLNTDRFIARVVNTSEDQTAEVVLQVYFDRNLVFSQEASLRDASVDFIHVFF